jgi:apolipoprotein N-acyltransferase
MTFRRRLLLAALSGALVAATTPNASALFLLPVCLVPLMLAVEGLTAGRSALETALFGFVFWILAIPWIVYTVHRYGEVGWPVAVFALVALTFALLPPFVVLGALVGAAAPGRPWTRMATWVAAFVVEEAIRTVWYFWGGFPWTLLANPLAEVPALAQGARLGGVALLGGMVVAANAGFAEAWRTRGRTRVAWASGTLAAILLVWGAGELSMRTPEPSGREVRAGVLQPNVAQEARWTTEALDRIWRELLVETRRFAREEHPDLVLWPESAAPYAWSFAPVMRQEVLALCREENVSILMTTIWSDRPGEEDAPLYNSALLVTPEGPALPPYFKQRLVPFGEYIPSAKVLGMIKPISRAVPGGFTPGTSAGLIQLHGLRLGGAVCYEIVYPWIPRAAARAGAGALFTLTNDAWYGELGARRQHFQAAVLRAVETGLPVVRAAITGISGWVDGRGRVLASIGPDLPGRFVARLPVAAHATTTAVRIGEAPAWVCLAALLAAILRVRLASPGSRADHGRGRNSAT